ncbi:MAG: hypothetical protein QOG89_1382 [Thermomicrobiales bacterium]|nr:hypothetical protein [Thermomicrobiales bacterium]
MGLLAAVSVEGRDTMGCPVALQPFPILDKRLPMQARPLYNE